MAWLLVATIRVTIIRMAMALPPSTAQTHSPRFLMGSQVLFNVIMVIILILPIPIPYHTGQTIRDGEKLRIWLTISNDWLLIEHCQKQSVCVDGNKDCVSPLSFRIASDRDTNKSVGQKSGRP